MPNEENKNLQNWWNNKNWTWSNDWNISSNDLNKTDSLDLDIDLNLDWIGVDDSDKWDQNNSSKKSKSEDWKIEPQDWNKKVETEIKQDNVKQDNVKQDNVKQDNVKQDNVKQDNLKQDNVKQDNVKQDNVKQDNVKQDNVKQDNVKQDNVKQDNVKQDNVKQDNEELSSSQKDINIESKKNLEETSKKDSVADVNDKSQFVEEELEALKPIKDDEDLLNKEKEWLNENKNENKNSYQNKKELDIEKFWKSVEDDSKEKWPVVEDNDDWLLEEDKKVEEVKKEKEQKTWWSMDFWDKNNIDNKKNKTEKINNELSWDQTKSVEKKDEMSLEDLDIPFVEKDPKKDNDISKSLDQSIENKDELKKTSDIENNNKKNVESKKDDLDLDSLGIPQTNNVEEKLQQDKKQEWLHTENLWEDVLENNDGDIVSDIGDLNSKWNGYVPNEHDFNQTVGALNSTEKWQIDLDHLQKDQKKANDSQLETNSSVEKQDWSLDLDSMISNFENNEWWQNENKDLSWVSSDINNNKSVENSNKTQNEWLDNVKNIENWTNNSIDLWSAEVSKSNVDLEKQPIEQNSDQNQQSVNQVNNQDINPNKDVVLNEPPKTKNKHWWLKIFILIILLLAWWIMILTKMYPEEFGDIMGAIKWQDTTTIEYSDNSNNDAVLENTENIVLNTGENVLDTWEIQEEPDPDSLAWQIEWNSGENQNIIEYESGDTINNTWHSADGEDFNAFEGLDEVIDPVDSKNAKLLEDLKNYKDQWDDYNEWGRSQWNSTAMKYGLYISKKAEGAINDIENGLEIDISEIEGYFAQFDVYLEKLSWLRDSIEWSDVESDDLISSWSNET